MKTARKTAAKAKPRNRKTRFLLTVEAQEMVVTYQPNWMRGPYPCGHFEFRSTHKPARRIPVSETGYRSHMAPMRDIAAADGPEAYARSVVLAALQAKPADPRQPALF